MILRSLLRGAGPARRAFATLAILAATVSAARAQSADPGERPTLKLGPVEVRPKLVFTDIGVDNNVYNSPDNPVRDFTFTAQPDVELAVNPGRFRISYFSGTQFVYYRDEKDLRATNRSFTARIDGDLAYVKPFFSYGSAHTSQRPNNEIDVRARRHPRTMAGGATFKVGYRSSIALTARRFEEEYDENVFFRGSELSRTLDNVTTTYEGAFAVDLTPLTSVSLVVSREESRFDRSPLRDSDTIRIAPTVRFSPLGLLNGSLAVGYRRFDGRDPLLPEYHGLVVTSTLGLKVYDRFQVESTFTRDVRYSYEEQLPYYLTTGGRATVTTLLGAGIEVRATGGLESMDYRAFAGEEAPGSDRQVIYGGGGGYRIADRMRFIVEVEFVERMSDRDPSREYKNHRIFATLNWGATTR